MKNNIKLLRFTQELGVEIGDGRVKADFAIIKKMVFVENAKFCQENEGEI